MKSSEDYYDYPHSLTVASKTNHIGELSVNMCVCVCTHTRKHTCMHPQHTQMEKQKFQTDTRDFVLHNCREEKPKVQAPAQLVPSESFSIPSLQPDTFLQPHIARSWGVQTDRQTDKRQQDSCLLVSLLFLVFFLTFIFNYS